MCIKYYAIGIDCVNKNIMQQELIVCIKYYATGIDCVYKILCNRN